MLQLLLKGVLSGADVIQLSWSIMWIVLPSIVFFVALPVALRLGAPFFAALALAIGVMVVVYAGYVSVMRALGVGSLS